MGIELETMPPYAYAVKVIVVSFVLVSLCVCISEYLFSELSVDIILSHTQ